MRCRLFLFIGLLFCIASRAMAGGTSQESLAGRWRFALDPGDTGMRDSWFAHDLPDHIHLPGTLQEQGFGDPPSVQSHWLVNDSSLQTFLNDPKYAPYRDGEFKSPFWLTPKRHYVGVAWYQREIEIPANWGDKRVVLHLERPHWQTTLWLDNHRIGSNDSLGTPHDYELAEFAAPGKHTITLRIDNRLNIPVGPHAHSVTDMSQTDWNGVLGDISLRATDKIWLDDVQIYPDVQNRKIHVIITIGNRTNTSTDATLTSSIKHLQLETVPIHVFAGGGSVAFDYSLGPDARTWDEFSPKLYSLHLQLSGADRHDECTTIFGLRQITHVGNQFLLNGHPIMLRGTLECCVFPLTGYPPMTIKPWERIFKIARSYGLNHLRFHTWCPPEVAFEAADQMGFYLEVECSCWGRFGDGGPLDKWMPAEGDRMLRTYGNHPSFMFLVATNEPKGKKAADFLAGVVERWKDRDPRRLYSAGAGAAQVDVPQSDFHIEYATRFHQDNGELTRTPQTADDYRQYVDAQPIPSVAHELGQWCAYPNFDEIPKFKGFLRAGNLEIFRDFLNSSGMGEQAHDFLMASGKFQAILYKAEIEKVLRTPRMGGFELLDLHDFPGQGYSPVGVLDEFWDSKGYITPKEYTHFAGPTVPLARFSKLIFTSDESADVPIDISHFGPTDLESAVVSWRISNADGHVLRRGSFDPQTIPNGQLTHIGTIPISMRDLSAPSKLDLQIAIDGTSFVNSWDFWVYPSHLNATPAAGVTVAHDLSNATLQKIMDGASVLALVPPSQIAGAAVDTFEPIFWNRILFPKETSQTMGVLCNPRHPAFAEFPTDSYSNWQWWDLQQLSKPMILGKLPSHLVPIIQLIDDWNSCRKLGLLIEGRLGKGKLLLCSIDLENNLAERPVARQLLRSLLDYVSSNRFSPKTVLTLQMVRSLVKP
jgi:hypothetical protein